jgi:hypothetical protein
MHGIPRPPFPYVSYEEGNDGYIFKYYELDRDSEPSEIINNVVIKNTLLWLKKYMWEHSTNPFVHGDLTDDNIVYNSPNLWIIDYEPGLTKRNPFGVDIFTRFIYYFNILIDLCDFGNSIIQKIKELIMIIHSHYIILMN